MANILLFYFRLCSLISKTYFTSCTCPKKIFFDKFFSMFESTKGVSNLDVEGTFIVSPPMHSWYHWKAKTSSNPGKHYFSVSVAFRFQGNHYKFTEVAEILALFSNGHISVWVNFKPHKTLFAPKVLAITFPMTPHTTM